MAASITQPEDGVWQALTHHSDYPINIIHPQEFRHELKEYQDHLTAASDRLFDEYLREYRILDLVGPDRSFLPVSQTYESKQEVEQLMDCKTPDPLTRYIFIQSANSRGRLACEKDQLMFTLSYYQVMPSFINFLVAFKAREDPYTQASFHYEVRLSKSGRRVSIPSLNRSGFRTQHCFNLIGIEKDHSAGADPWRIRQTAAYHSFDVDESRSVWIVLKGNSLVQDRLAAEAEDYLNAYPDYPGSREGCFLANLRSHMLIFRWACQNWSQYIEHFSERLKRFKTVANYTPVAEATGDDGIKKRLEKSGTFNSIVSRSRMGTWNSSSPTLPSTPFSDWIPRVFKSRSTLSNENSNTETKGPMQAANKNAQPVTSAPTRDIDLDKEFSFEQLQSLQRLGDQIREAIQILGENKTVLREITDHFNMLLGSRDFTSHVKLDIHAGETSEFFRRVESLCRDLDRHERHLETLLLDLDKKAVLFNEVIQYRNMRMGEFLAKQGLISTMQAEESAAKSRREAASMHAITIWTLIFLPGTFVATFFSSGILDFGGEIVKFGDWSTSWIGLQLFFVISLPIMILTLAGWAYFVHLARKKEAFRVAATDYEMGNISEKAVEEGRALGINVS